MIKSRVLDVEPRAGRPLSSWAGGSEGSRAWCRAGMRQRGRAEGGGRKRQRGGDPKAEEPLGRYWQRAQHVQTPRGPELENRTKGRKGDQTRNRGAGSGAPGPKTKAEGSAEVE